MSFASLDELWGGNSNSGQQMQAPQPQAPQKVYSGGNAVQKVYAGGNVPQKVVTEQSQDALEAADAMLRKMALHQQRQAAEIAHLRQIVAQSMSRAQEPTRKGLTVMEITVIVLALVFILLVLFLISTVRQLTSAL